MPLAELCDWQRIRNVAVEPTSPYVECGDRAEARFQQVLKKTPAGGDPMGPSKPFALFVLAFLLVQTVVSEPADKESAS
jgi:hypothetical protein